MVDNFALGVEVLNDAAPPSSFPELDAGRLCGREHGLPDPSEL